LALDRLSVPLGLAVVAVAALSLSACGRKGPLDPPPSAAISQPPPAASRPSALTSAAPPTPEETGVKTGFDAQGNPVAAPGQKKNFFLDPLLR
jgi:predicted small lipoprotein YifL